jgi:hypothetical protein
MISMTEPTIQIIASPDFQAQTRKLSKRYRSIRTDLQPLLVIYSKSDQKDVSADQIRAIIAAFDEPAAVD